MQAWKVAEKTVAKKVGGKRLGVTGINTVDVETDRMAIEVKHNGKVCAFVRAALDQAKRNRKGDRVPVAVIHPKHSSEYLAVLTLDDLVCLLGVASADGVALAGCTTASSDAGAASADAVTCAAQKGVV